MVTMSSAAWPPLGLDHLEIGTAMPFLFKFLPLESALLLELDPPIKPVPIVD